MSSGCGPVPVIANIVSRMIHNNMKGAKSIIRMIARRNSFKDRIIGVVFIGLINVLFQPGSLGGLNGMRESSFAFRLLLKTSTLLHLLEFSTSFFQHNTPVPMLFSCSGCSSGEVE
jgi:hypothetical protein